MAGEWTGSSPVFMETREVKENTFSGGDLVSIVYKDKQNHSVVIGRNYFFKNASKAFFMASSGR